MKKMAPIETGLPAVFEPVFQYRVRDGIVLAATPLPSLERPHPLLACEGTVYARVADGKVLYIGKADGPLVNRIREHFRRLRVASDGKQLQYRKAVDGKTVTIFAFQPPPTAVAGIAGQIPVHQSVEAHLLATLRPPYATLGLRRRSDHATADEAD